MDMDTDFRDRLAQALARVAGVEEEAAAASLGAPTARTIQKEDGRPQSSATKSAGVDWCSTLAFALAKERKENPAKLAGKWAQEGEWPAFVKRAEAAGPYLNFHFNSGFWWDVLAQNSQAPEMADRQKTSAKKKPGKVLIEFPSVNPNKPWHVGHLRNALLGDSLARLLSATGHEVERQDYIDDLGLQVAQSVWGRTHLPDPTAPEGSGDLAGKLDHILGWQYVEVAKRAEEEAVAAQVRALLKKLEEGDGPEAREARSVVEHCVKAQYQTAFAFGVFHDALIFESDIVRAVFKEGMEKIVSSGAVRKETDGKNQGCVVVKLGDEKEFAGMESPDKVLIRSDGTATYTGKDVAFQLWKFGRLSADFSYAPFVSQPDGSVAYASTGSKDGKKMKYGHADTVVNVIGMEQAYPQQVIQVVLRKMGLQKQADRYVHIAYEHVVLPEGRFSGRAGTWMGAGGGPGFTADELLREVEREADGKIAAGREGGEAGGPKAGGENEQTYSKLRGIPLDYIQIEKSAASSGVSDPRTAFANNSWRDFPIRPRANGPQGAVAPCGRPEEPKLTGRRGVEPPSAVPNEEASPAAGAEARKGTDADTEALKWAGAGAKNAGRHGTPDEAERKKIARAVAVAAIRFSFLRTSANQKITFDYDKALSLSGDSGPYVQYAYARAVHILKKGDEAAHAPAAPEEPSAYEFNGQELALARAILRWPTLLSACAAKYQVHPIADYAIDLSGKFNQFYNTTPVMKAGKKEEVAARLLEVAAFREALGRAMDILGIGRLERM